MFPAIFLDRDGVIIENRPSYVRSWEDVAFIPGALTGLAQASHTPYKIVIITNQSAVGRGIITLEEANKINQGVVEVITAAGGRVDGVFMCPHEPSVNCSCRKPQPGLLLQAASQLSLDLKNSVMIGDAFTDLLAGHLAGIANTIMVLTGRGAHQAKLPAPAELNSFNLYPSIAEALAVFS